MESRPASRSAGTCTSARPTAAVRVPLHGARPASLSISSSPASWLLKAARLLLWQQPDVPAKVVVLVFSTVSWPSSFLRHRPDVSAVRSPRCAGAATGEQSPHAARAVVVDGEHQRVDGQALGPQADAVDRQEVHVGQRRVDDERRGLHRRPGAGVGAVEVREHAEVEPARRRREVRREAVGEPGRPELAHQRQRPTAEADHAGAVGEVARCP